MIVYLTIVRYPRLRGWAGFLSMALFRFALWGNRNIRFYKLLGCGKNGSFDIHPDWRQWGLLEVYESNTCNPAQPFEMHQNNNGFIHRWWRFFNCEKWCIALQPLEGHGTWDKKQCFGSLEKNTAYEGRIAVLTRATIRLQRLAAFWGNVQHAASELHTVPGFITSVGIGEVPWIKQATFSIWQSKEAMKNYAYKIQNHKDVIRKTKQQNWYSEDMFVRFKIIASCGMLHGKDPLAFTEK